MEFHVDRVVDRYLSARCRRDMTREGLTSRCS